MNITVYLGTTSSPKNYVPKQKNLSTFVYTGTIRENTSILNPVIEFDSLISEKASGIPFNYAHIPAFNRYYYIENIEIDESGMFTIYFHVDVLESYWNSIKNISRVIVSRNEDFDNLCVKDLKDSNIWTTANQKFDIITFDGSSSAGWEKMNNIGYNYVITLLGAGFVT